MIMHTTAKLAEKLEITPEPQAVTDGFLSWRAHYVQEHGSTFVIFMNDASRLNVVINHATDSKLKALEKLFFHNLREILLDLGVNSDVVDLYVADLGEVAYAKNADRKKTAQLNKNTGSVWWALRDLTDDVEISVSTSHVTHNATGRDEVLIPREKTLELLTRYGLPIHRACAFDLTVRLELGGEDAIRRLRVPARMTFKQLHRLVQTAFGWHDSHLYSFGFFTDWGDDPSLARPDRELVCDEHNLSEDSGAAPAGSARLCDYVPRYREIVHTYDSGNGWRHHINVEDVIEDCEEDLPILLSGEGDSPPEDVGGVGGYADFLDIIADPDHEEHESMARWARSQWWRPFDFETTAGRVKRAL